jgi:uncharacterized protein (UPF0332 family)
VALHHDLLEQATHLGKRERKKPKQASLRRAVSSAYYALFHLLTSEGANALAQNKPEGLTLTIQRAFNHGDMKTVCNNFVAGHVAIIKNQRPGTPPRATRDMITLPLDQRLFDVIQAFIDLQEYRHQADYDLNKQWSRLEVLTHIETVKQAFTDWAAIRTSDTARVFVIALLLQKHWSR